MTSTENEKRGGGEELDNKCLYERMDERMRESLREIIVNITVFWLAPAVLTATHNVEQESKSNKN